MEPRLGGAARIRRPEVLGQSLDLIVPGHFRAAHWRGFNDAMAKWRPEAAQEWPQAYIDMTFALVAVDGVVQGSVAVARDVTERVSQQKVGQMNAPASS